MKIIYSSAQGAQHLCCFNVDLEKRVKQRPTASCRSMVKQHKCCAPGAAQAAFTMVEIAIALAVIGFALVAIIGILPRGMNVQKDNREETIINQDGPYVLEAIRSGAQGMDHLTNYIDAVGVVLQDTNPVPVITTNWDFYTAAPYVSNFVGLMSLPKGSRPFDPDHFVLRSQARMRALSGSALEQNGLNSLVAFSYLVTSEVVAYSWFADDSTNWWAYLSTPNDPATCTSLDCLTRSNRWMEVPQLVNNLHELRLRFLWPQLPNGKVGSNRQLFRTLIGGSLSTNSVLPLFQLQAYRSQ